MSFFDFISTLLLLNCLNQFICPFDTLLGFDPVVALSVRSIRYLLHMLFLTFSLKHEVISLNTIPNLRVDSGSLVTWTVFLSLANERGFSGEVHYIKHEVKQSQISHNSARPFRSTFSSVVMSSSFHI